MPFRLAVLECDTPVPAVLRERGSYGSVFEALLSKAGADFCVSKYDVVTRQTYPQLASVDGILISGSTFANDAWILALVEYVKTVVHKVPLVGICFGHQIIGRALGAQTGVAPSGWEIAVDKVDLGPEGRELFGVETLNLHQMHRDQVASVPAGLVCLGSSPKCPVQGLYKPGCVFTLQAHPEFDAFIMREILRTRHEQGVFDDEMFAEGMARADGAHDGGLVAAKIWEFLGV